MHVVGKILIFLLLICAGFGFIIAARLVNSRGNWMKQLQEAKTKNEKTSDQLASARKDFEEARGDLEREMLRWNRFFSPVNGAFDPTTDAIIASAGTGIGITPNMELYAFQIGNGGNSTYVGSFAAVQVRANESGLKASFKVRKEDEAGWTGQSWRLRTVIPSSFLARIAGLQGELVVADELLKNQENNLAKQSKLAEEARSNRDDRITELMGTGNGAKVTGLVAQINEVDDQRNASLLRVDKLRRDIQAAEARTRRLIQENNNLANSLPGQPPRQQAEARERLN